MEDSWIAQKDETAEKNEEITVFKKEDIYILICSVLLGVFFNLLFYKKSLGISYPLFVIAFYMAFLWIFRHQIAYKFNFGWFLTIPIILLSSTYFIFSNQIFAVLNFWIIPVLIIAQTILINEENRHKWYEARFIEDISYGIFNRALGYTSKPFVVGLSVIRIRQSHEKYDVLKKVLIGLAISMPLLLIIVCLLSSADRVFNHFLVEISSSFGTINIGDFSLQGIIGLLVALIVFSYLWSFSDPDISVKDQPQGSLETSNRSCDPIISVTILGVINCVYVAFTIIQFAYMFGSLKHALPPDFTYAEYARRGFFELLVVTLINFSLLLSSIRFTRKGGKFVARTVQVQLSLLIFCTVVILFSAYVRMSLYEETYGYTYLRVLTHSFMIFLAVLFLIAFYKIWNERISLLRPYIVIAIMAYVIINFANIDVLIAQKNIERYVETGKLDTQYLSNLSLDSVPEVVNLLNDEMVSKDIKKYLAERQEDLALQRSWQSFNVSRHKAKQVLTQSKL